MTGKPIILTETEEKAIIEYYLHDHSIREATEFFNFTNKRVVIRVLKKYSIQLRSQEDCLKLRSVKSKLSCIDKYGVENISQLESIKAKKKETFEQHVLEDPNFTKNIKEKAKQTCLEHFGVEYATQSDEIKNKSINTCKEKYGTEHVSQATTIKEKIKQTNLEKYGCEYACQANIVKEKIKQTNLEKYGVEWHVQSDNFKEKTKQTCREKYGVSYFAQSDLANKLRKCVYIFNNEQFDSFPELCFYMFYFKHDAIISRNPKGFEYFYNNNKHKYFPDFEVEGQLYEIKGDQFLKEDGTWQNPFNHSLDERVEAKRQCALDNNVIILYKEDYLKYIEWFNNMGFIADEYKRNPDDPEIKKQRLLANHNTKEKVKNTRKILWELYLSNPELFTEDDYELAFGRYTAEKNRDYKCHSTKKLTELLEKLKNI